VPRPRRVRPKARPRQAPPRQSRRPQTLTAAGAQITTRPGGKPKQGTVAQGWQDEAWYYYDTVGELAQACQWVANSLSRVDLDVMEVKPDGSVEPTTNPDALAALDALYDGDTGQSDMLATMGVHLSCPGETYLVGVPGDAMNPYAKDLWRVVSNKELRQQAGQWIIDRGDGIEEKYADGSKPDQPAEALVIRIWRPHAAQWVQANSPVRAALPVLRTLEKVSQHIAASADSRLAGAGVFVIPKGATWETPTRPEDANTDDPTAQASPMGTLTEAMLTPIGDRGNAAARVPIVMALADDLADKVQHIKFDLPFDEQVIPLSDNQIRRLAVSMDMPVEALLGVGDVNHWTGWLISEEGIKVHIEPLVNVICTALTQRYLWPILAGTLIDPLDSTGVPDEVKRYVIRGDTAALRQRPDMTEQAMALHARMVLTDAALAREVGFDTGDILVPGSEEFVRRLRMAIAGGVTTGDQTQAALEALGAGLTPAPSEVPAEERHPAIGTDVPLADPAKVSAPAALPAGQGTETRGTPDRAAAVAASAAPDPAALRASAASMRAAVAAAVAARNGPQVAQYGAVLAVADLAVSRALERANARLFGRGHGKPRPVTGDRVAEALRDAWTLLPAAAANLGVDPDMLTDGCERYTQELLARGMPHDRDLLGAVVKHMLTEQAA
jgi:hypothetical protein